MKDYILFICVLILLLFIYILHFGIKNRSTLEKFSGKEKSIQPKVIQPESSPLLQNANSEQQLYSLQRIYPRYGAAQYDVGNYPDVVLPGELIGCGSRREPCYGGSQQVVANILPPLDISNKNIAPRNGDIGPYAPFEQVGYIYKIFAPYEENAYRPLYLNRVYPNTKYPVYDYFTMSPEGEKYKVITPSKHRELGTNDQVQVKGEDCWFRVTVNQSNVPSYPRVVPY
jgi:hypothetical protein